MAVVAAIDPDPTADIAADELITIPFDPTKARNGEVADPAASWTLRV